MLKAPAGVEDQLGPWNGNETLQTGVYELSGCPCKPHSGIVQFTCKRDQ